MANRKLGASLRILAERLDAEQRRAMVVADLATGWHGGAAELALRLGELAVAAITVDAELSAACRGAHDAPAIARVLRGQYRDLVSAWLTSAADDESLRFAPVLAAAAGKRRNVYAERSARARVLRGPLDDALGCARFAGGREWLEGDTASRSRFELLVWHASSSARAVPALGEMWHAAEHLDVWNGWARGTLWERASAARWALVAADGVPTESTAVDAALPALGRLAHHPDPIVWFPAVRALGRLAARVSAALALLRQWERSSAASDRRRATAAVASMPAQRAADVDRAVATALAAKGADPWMRTSLGIALPYLAREHREQLRTVRRSLGRRRPAPTLCESLGNGLRALWLGGELDEELSGWCDELRDYADHAPRRSNAAASAWHRAQLALSFGQGESAAHPALTLEKVIRSAVTGDARKAHAASKRWLKHLVAELPERTEASKRPGPDGGVATEWIEGASLVCALSPWDHVAAAAGEGSPYPRLRTSLWPSLLEWADAGLRETRNVGVTHAALRVEGRWLDVQPDVARGELVGRLAHLLSELDWVVQPTERQTTQHAKRVANLVRRGFEAVADARSADDPSLFGRFAAWWAIAGGPRSALEWLGRSEGLARGAHAAFGLAAFDAIAAMHGGEFGPEALGPYLLGTLRGVRAEHTRMARAVAGLHAAATNACDAPRLPTAELSLATSSVTRAAERLRLVRADAVWALSESPKPQDEHGAPPPLPLDPDALAGAVTDACGPALGHCVAPALDAIAQEATARRGSGGRQSLGHRIGNFRLIEMLAEHGMGEVWLVTGSAGGRKFVLKRPRTSVAGPAAKASLMAAIRMEAHSLTSFYHPNVAKVIEFDLDGDTPYVVFEYLVGCSLDEYITARPLSIKELKPIVRGVCDGLSAIHRSGMVHCDIKPANIYLCLDAGTVEGRFVFEPESHRDGMRVLSTVVIDFGTATAPWLADAVVAGTPCYAAPEQWSGDVPLSPATDMYALASSLMEAVTGAAFFENIDPHGIGPATMTQDPVATHAARERLPDDFCRLLTDASHVDPAKRVRAERFAERFEALRAL